MSCVLGAACFSLFVCLVISGCWPGALQRHPLLWASSSPPTAHLPLSLPLSSPWLLQFAYKFGSSEAPRAWSKYTAGTSANRKAVEPEKTGANVVPLGEGGDGKKGPRGKKAAEEGG